MSVPIGCQAQRVRSGAHASPLPAIQRRGNGCLLFIPLQRSLLSKIRLRYFSTGEEIQFSPECLKPILNLQVPGTVDLLPFKDNFPLYRKYIETCHAKTHGMAVFSIPQAEAAKSRETWLAVARQGDEVIGLMQYKLKGQMMKQELVAFDFLFDSPAGKYLLLDWIARHLDQVATVKLVLKPGLVGETLFTDIRPDIERYFVAPMGRVINVEALAGFPVGDGKLGISLTDPDCPWNEGDGICKASMGSYPWNEPENRESPYPFRDYQRWSMVSMTPKNSNCADGATRTRKLKASCARCSPPQRPSSTPCINPDIVKDTINLIVEILHARSLLL